MGPASSLAHVGVKTENGLLVVVYSAFSRVIFVELLRRLGTADAVRRQTSRRRRPPCALLLVLFDRGRRILLHEEDTAIAEITAQQQSHCDRRTLLKGRHAEKEEKRARVQPQFGLQATACGCEKRGRSCDR